MNRNQQNKLTEQIESEDVTETNPKIEEQDLNNLLFQLF